MTLNPVYTGESTRKFSTAGEHRAELVVSIGGEVVSSTPVVVDVPGRR